MRKILHVDMDAFFASVELRRHPELKGKPVIVGGDGDPKKRGVVSAASYEARKFGVRSGMPLRVAYRKCPQAVFLPVDFEEYMGVSERFMEILRGYTPLVESFGLDEAFLEVTEIQRETAEIALEIKRRIREELGLTCSVGVAHNKLLAKLASDMKKPDGLTVIKTGEVEKVLSDLPVRRLWGVGEKTEKRLTDMGIETIGDLARAPVRYLIANFGEIIGRTLHDHARGMDDSPVVPFYEPQSMGREVTYQVDTGDAFLIRETLKELVDDVVMRMRDGGYKGKTVTVKVRYSDFRTHTKAKTLEDLTDSMEDILMAAMELLERFEMKKKVRLVGVNVSKLEKAI
jgi:DNA polymerase-4